MRPDVSKYFEDDDKNVRYFVGNKLVIYIPKRYDDMKLLSITDEVSTLGLFKMIINDTLETGLMLPSVITMKPADIEETSYNDTPCYKCTFKKGDVFITNTVLVKSAQMLYRVFTELISLGHMPDWIDYEKAPFIFDKAAEVAGVNFGTNHAVMELIFATLYRDAKDPYKQYRFTNMKQKPKFVGLKQITYSADGTLARIGGSYMEDGIRTALVNASDTVSDIETTLRS